MANYTTSADLIDDALFRAGEPTDDTSDFQAAAVAYLNRVYQAIWDGGSELVPEINENWAWIKKDNRGILTMEPSVSSGTVSVTNGSATITLSEAQTPAISTSMQEWFFKVDNHPDVFEITSNDLTTTQTLESVYTGETDGTATFRIWKPLYGLASDVVKITSAMQGFDQPGRRINEVTLEEMNFNWPKNQYRPGQPYNFAMFASTQKVMFSHHGGTSATDLIKIEYEYIKSLSDLADDSTEPAVPRHYRKTMAITDRDWET